MAGYNISAMLNDGYSYGDIYSALSDNGLEDNYIAKTLADSSGFNYEVAKADGATDEQILAHLKGEKEPGEWDPIGAVGDVGKLIKDSYVQTKGAIGSLFESSEGDPLAKEDWKDRWQKEAEDRTKQRKAELDASGNATGRLFPGTDFIQRQDIADTSSSTGFSAVSMAPSLAGSALTAGLTATGVGVPLAAGVGIATGMVGSGTLAFKMDKNMFTRQLLEKTNADMRAEIGRDMNPDERKAYLEATDDIRSNHAFWEAGPEAAGNAIGLFGLGKIFSGVAGKGIKKVLSGFAIDYLGEVSTETVTQTKQKNDEIKLGLDNGEERSLLSPSDNWKSFKEVAPTVAVLSGVTGGAAGIAGKTYGLAANRVQNQVAPPMTADDFANISAAMNDQTAEQKAETAESIVSRASTPEGFEIGPQYAPIDVGTPERLINESSLERNQGIGIPVTAETSALAQQEELTPAQQKAERVAGYNELFGVNGRKDFAGSGYAPATERISNNLSLERNSTGGPITPETSALANQTELTPAQQRAEMAGEYQDLFSVPTVLSDETEQRLAVIERQMREGEAGQRWERPTGTDSDGQSVEPVGGNRDGVKSTDPEWLKKGSPLYEAGKDGVAVVIAKVRAGKKLTPRQSFFWREIKKAAYDAYENDPATIQGRELDSITKQGVDLTEPKTIPVGDLSIGDKVAIRLSNGTPTLVEHKGFGEDGKAILESDLTTIAADPWDTVESLGVKSTENNFEQRMRDQQSFGSQDRQAVIREPGESASSFIKRRKEEAAIRKGSTGRTSPMVQQPKESPTAFTARMQDGQRQLPGDQGRGDVVGAGTGIVGTGGGSTGAGLSNTGAVDGVRGGVQETIPPASGETLAQYKSRTGSKVNLRQFKELRNARTIQRTADTQGGPTDTGVVAPVQSVNVDAKLEKKSPVSDRASGNITEERKNSDINNGADMGVATIHNQVNSESHANESQKDTTHAQEKESQDSGEPRVVTPAPWDIKPSQDKQTVEAIAKDVDPTVKYDGAMADLHQFTISLPDGKQPSFSIKGDITPENLKAEIGAVTERFKKADSVETGASKGEGSPTVKESLSVQFENKKRDTDKTASEPEQKTADDGGIGRKETIQDFGEKIGGARKDTARKTGTSTKKASSKDGTPLWRKRFISIENAIRPGEWSIADTKSKSSFGGILPQKFASKELAEEAIPLYAVAMNHVVREDRDIAGKFGIYKNVGKRKVFKVVNKEFDSREDGMKYMAIHAEEILSIKTTFGEEILPAPEIAERVGAKRRDTDATSKMFEETFAPRGIEFGKWNNQDERQLIMNHAYDGLIDLAEAMGVEPKALMLNGELGIAFGARGQGLSGAKAHYERDYSAINLTKMTGAGSLAHEWMHAFDHYLARQDGKAKSERVKDENGNMVFHATTPKYDFQSHGPRFDSNVRKELQSAHDMLMKGLYRKAEAYVEDTKTAEKFIGVMRQNLQEELAKVRSYLAADNTSYAKKNGGHRKSDKGLAPASLEQLTQFDQLANVLIEGGSLDVNYKTIKGSNGRDTVIQTNETLDSIAEIIQSVRNVNAFRADNGILDKVIWGMRAYNTRIKMFEDAKVGTEKTKKVPTKFALEAKKMDQARSGDYWGEPHEMIARAFASYVEDKIAENGGKSEFLVYRANGGIILPMIDGFIARPYPEGKERIAINKLFDTFVGELKSRNTEKGVELYSKSTQSIPTSERANIESELKEAIGGLRSRRLVSNGTVTIVDTQEDIKSLIRDASAVKYSKSGLIQAAYVNGKIIMARDGIAKGQSFPVLLHEIAHATSLGFKNDAQYKRILQSLEDRKDEQSATGDAIRAAMARVPSDTRVEDYQSEVAAYLIENEGNTKFGIVRRLINFFKGLAFKSGLIDANKLSHQDLAIFARAAVNAASSVSMREQAMYSVMDKFGPVDVESANFKRWFEGSKIVDEDGKPLVVYHGTNKKNDTDSFTGRKPGSKRNIIPSEKYANMSPWFTDDKFVATKYANGTMYSPGNILYPDSVLKAVYLKAINPHVVDMSKVSLSEKEKEWTFTEGGRTGTEIGFRKEREVRFAHDNGHDSVIFLNAIDGVEHRIGKYIQVFSPTQIKSSTSNTGDFSETDPRIQYSKVSDWRNNVFSGTRDAIDRAVVNNPKWQDRWETYLYNLISTNDPRERVYKRAVKPSDADIVTIEKLRGKRAAEEQKQFREEVVVPLCEHMGKNRLTMDDLGEYSHAKHAPERNEKMRRVNAKRELDKLLNQMTDSQRAEYDERVEVLRSTLNKKAMGEAEVWETADVQDGYLDMIDEIVSEFDNRETAIAARRTAYDERVFTQDEIDNETPERVLKQIEKEEDRINKSRKFASDWDKIKDRLSGITDDTASEVVTKWEQSSKLAAIEKARVMQADISKQTIDTLYEAGELTEEEYKGLIDGYKFYVPLQRDGFQDTASGTGKITGPTGQPLKTAKGSILDVVNVMSNVIRAHDNAVSRKYKLEAGKVLYDFAESYPEAGITIEPQAKVATHDVEGNITMYPSQTEPDDGVFIKVGGERYLLKFATNKTTPEGRTLARFLDSIKWQDAQLNGMLKALHKVTRFLAAVNTSLAPVFMMTNFTKDMQTAFTHLNQENIAIPGLKKKVAKEIIPAIRGIWAAENGKKTGDMAKWYLDFSANGGKVGWMQSYEAIEDLNKELENEMKLHSEGFRTRKAAHKILKAIEGGNTAIENGVRLSTYKTLVEGGVSRRKAASIASALTVDFTQHGKFGPQFNALYMFANAGIQGTVRMVHALKSSPKVRKIAGGIVMSGVAMQLLALASGGDDDSGEPYIWGINDSIKERNAIFMIPGSGGKYHKLPTAYGYNVFYCMGTEIANSLYVIATGRKYNHAQGAMRVINSAANSFNPLNSATLMQTASPTLLDPLAQIEGNTTWSGGKLMPEQNQYGAPVPDSQRTWRGTPQIYKTLAQGLNKMTGGDKFEGGAIDISPETVELAWETATGSLGRFITNTMSIPVGAVTGDLEAKQIPFVSSLYGSFDDKVISTRYYDMIDKAKIADLRVKGAENSEERSTAMHNPDYMIYKRTKETEKQLKFLSKRLQVMRASGDKDGAESVQQRIIRLQSSSLNRMKELQ